MTSRTPQTSASVVYHNKYCVEHLKKAWKAQITRIILYLIPLNHPTSRVEEKQINLSISFKNVECSVWKCRKEMVKTDSLLLSAY